MRGPLPKEEFDWIFSRVPLLTVELVITSPGRGVLLTLREIEPCRGRWHLPGGTVRFGEPAVDAARRVAACEVGLSVSVGELLGYIEYPSHYKNGLDSPVGLAFRVAPDEEVPESPGRRWFTDLPRSLHDEQRAFLLAHVRELSGHTAHP